LGEPPSFGDLAPPLRGKNSTLRQRLCTLRGILGDFEEHAEDEASQFLV